MSTATEWLLRVLWEAEACRIAGGIEGFPDYIGTVDHCDQRPSIVTEYLGDDKAYDAWTLYDVLYDQKGPVLTHGQMIKVSGIAKMLHETIDGSPPSIGILPHRCRFVYSKFQGSEL